MEISKLMQRDVEVISGDATVREAAERMRDLDVGMLPVQVDGRVTGMLTDRDIVVRCIAEGGDAKSASVQDVMTEEAQWCSEDDELEDVAHIMSEKQIQRILVVVRDKRVAGILSLADLVRDPEGSKILIQVFEKLKSPTKPTATSAEQGAQH